jgi:hypothetical protein
MAADKPGAEASGKFKACDRLFGVFEGGGKCESEANDY